MELIPDLPDDVARECLLRSSFKQFPVIASVCKGWKREVSLPEFSRRRRSSRHSQKLLAMAQARVDPNREPGSGKIFGTPVYRITVLEPVSGVWTELPPVPGLSNGLPLFCRLASAGSDLVVLGGLDPVTWLASDSVFIFSFLNSTWRVGATMPGVRRSFFGCASDFNRTVYVVGGHDEEKTALTSAIAYDVAKDTWILLPDMARERDECMATFHAGKLHVIGGYATEEQGQFGKSAESFDVAEWQWDPVEENFLYSAVCPRTCVADENGDLYTCHDGDVMERRNDTWHIAGKLPADVCNAAYVAVWQGMLLVIGSARFGDPVVGYVWDLSNSGWVKLETHKEYSGHVQAGCCLEI